MSLNAQKTREFSPNVLRRIKLRTRLFVTFLIISLVPVITIGIFSYHACLRIIKARAVLSQGLTKSCRCKCYGICKVQRNEKENK